MISGIGKLWESVPAVAEGRLLVRCMSRYSDFFFFIIRLKDKTNLLWGSFYLGPHTVGGLLSDCKPGGKDLGHCTRSQACLECVVDTEGPCDLTAGSLKAGKRILHGTPQS